MKYKIKFFNNYYDGPISGVVSYEGKLNYFHMSAAGQLGVSNFFEDTEEEEWQTCWMPRLFKVYQLPKRLLLKIMLEHKVFELWKTIANTFFGGYSSRFFRLYYKLFKPYKEKSLDKLCNCKVIGAFIDNEYTYE